MLDNGLELLLGSHVQEQTFLTSDFEARPRLLGRIPGPEGSKRAAAVTSLPGLGRLDEILRDLESQGIAFQWGVDINAVRFSSGKRQVAPASESGGIARRASIWPLFHKQGYTLQVHQPQRFDDNLHRLCFALEQRFGCLVGANAYLTPAGTQGLAPHFDDVEIFVCQTDGRKRWKIYAPPPGWQLANQHSRDLEEAELGPPTMEVLLQPGDVLYMPRGTVHQAAAQSAASSHITLSTYQRWSTLDLASGAIREALNAVTGEVRPAAPLCQGLPLGFLVGNQSAASSIAPLTARILRGFADALDGGQGMMKKPATSQGRTRRRQKSKPPSWVSAAVDTLAIDFFQNRLPPPAHLSAAWPRGSRPSSSTDLLTRRGPPGLCRIAAAPPDPAEAPPAGPRSVMLLHCMRNRRDRHMVNSRRQPQLPIAFPSTWTPTLERIFGNDAKPVRVSTLADDMGAGGPNLEEAMRLAEVLWTEGVISCARECETEKVPKRQRQEGPVPTQRAARKRGRKDTNSARS